MMWWATFALIASILLWPMPIAPRSRWLAQPTRLPAAPIVSTSGLSMILAAIIAALRSGSTVLEAIEHQCAMPVAGLDGLCDVDALTTALRARRKQGETKEQLTQVAHGIGVAHALSARLGCPAASCMEAVREAYLRLQLCEDLRRNACAVPKSTMHMLLGLPIVTVGLGELLGANPIGVLFGSWQGMLCLGLGACCYGCGAVWMHRLLAVM